MLRPLFFADLDTLEPRVAKLFVSFVSSSPTVSVPRTTATTTTLFARFLDGAAYGARRDGGRRRSRCCVCSGISQEKSEKSHCVVWSRIYLRCFGLTFFFAGIGALGPLVLNVFVLGRSAFLVPSTARSATADSAGFPELAAFWTPICIGW